MILLIEIKNISIKKKSDYYKEQVKKRMINKK